LKEYTYQPYFQLPLKSDHLLVERVQLGLLEDQDQLEPQDLQGLPGLQVVMVVVLEPQVFLELQDYQGKEEAQVMQGLLVQQDFRALQDPQDHLVLVVEAEQVQEVES
jgi:hypothetical protein